jgi:hypothetical protein
MKPTLLLLTLASSLLFFTSCKKDEILASSSLQGKWELRSVSGGLSGGSSYQPGNTHFLELTASTYRFAAFGDMISEGSYTISKDINPHNGQTMEQLNFENGHSVFYELSGKKLTIYDGSTSLDGTVSMYEKIGEPVKGWCGTPNSGH